MTELYSKKDELTHYATIIGIVGCFLRLAYSVSYFFEIDLIYRDLRLFFFVGSYILIVVSMIGLANLIDSEKGKQFLIVFFCFDIVQFVLFYQRLLTFPGYQWSIVKNIVISIPYLVLYAYYWKSEIYAIIAFFMRMISVFLIQIRITLFQIFIIELDDIPEITDLILEIIQFLLMIYHSLVILECLLLILWLYKVFQVPTTTVPYGQVPTGQIPTAGSTYTPTTSRQQAISTSDRPIRKTIKLPIIGEVRGMPMLLHWCNTCNRQVNLKSRRWSEEEIRKTHNCPKCNSVVKGFYADPEENRYYKFMLGLIIISGGIITSTIEGNFGSYGYIPAIIIFGLAIIEIIIGGFLIWSSSKIVVEQPPEHASETVVPVPSSEFLREMTILVVIGLIGGAILWQINALILIILMNAIP